MKTKIYALRENHFVRYVGKTARTLEERLAGHLRDARNGNRTHKCYGLRAMLRQGKIPSITLLESVEGDGCDTERKWIKYFRKYGIDLWNLTDGGEGVPGRVCSVLTRAKIGASNSRCTRTPEMKAQNRNTHLGKRHSLSTRLMIAAITKEKLRRPETRAKLEQFWASRVGSKHSPEAIEKMRISKTGLHISSEVKEKIRAKLKGRTLPLSTRKKMRLSKIGRPWSSARRTAQNKRTGVAIKFINPDAGNSCRGDSAVSM